MNKTYHGQSDTLISYCIRAAIVSIVILGSAIFLSANASQVSLRQFPLTNTKLQQRVLAVVTYNYNSAKAMSGAATTTFGTERFLKGTINKRPGFSKPGLS